MAYLFRQWRMGTLGIPSVTPKHQVRTQSADLDVCPLGGTQSTHCHRGWKRRKSLFLGIQQRLGKATRPSVPRLQLGESRRASGSELARLTAHCGLPGPEPGRRRRPSGIWENLGAPPVGISLETSPCAVSTGVNPLEIFVTAGDSSLWCLTYLPNPVKSFTGPPADPGTSSWRGWQKAACPRTVLSTPAAVNGGPHLVEIFAIGSGAIGFGKQLLHLKMNWAEPREGLHSKPCVEYYAPTWSSETLEPYSPGDELTTPCPVSWGPERLDVFVLANWTIHDLSWAPNIWNLSVLEGLTVTL